MMPVILMTVIFLGCIFAFALTPDKPSETKKKSFEQVAPGTRSHLAIVPKNFGTQGSANVAGSSVQAQSVQSASFGTNGRMQ
jgi:hypothetical protein